MAWLVILDESAGEPLRPSVEPEVARRLALIRLLLARAEDMSHETPPFSFDAINRLHDAAEMFLALAAQNLGAAIPRDFLGYWDALKGPLGRELSYRGRMQKFNKVRVNLKHYGIEPAQTEIEDARITVSSLLRDECEALFSVALEDVSLTEFIACAQAKELVESAERAWQSQDRDAAMADLADALETLIRDYESRKMLGHGVSVFDNAADMTFEAPFFRRVADGTQRRFEEKLIDSLKNLDFAVMLVGLGIDFKRYGMFKAHTPHLVRSLDGTRHAYARRGMPEPTSDDFEFCRNFVVTSAIRLADFDYDLDWEEAYRSAVPKGSLAQTGTDAPGASDEDHPTAP